MDPSVFNIKSASATCSAYLLRAGCLLTPARAKTQDENDLAFITASHLLSELKLFQFCIFISLIEIEDTR